jgi:eukaryotic-like serine/threonine-protein kinase
VLVRVAIAITSTAYIAYLALLITCDLRRVASFGFVPVFDVRGVTVSQVQLGSIASLAGLQPGDRLTRVNGQVLEGAADWQRVRVYLDPSQPVTIEIDRGGRSVATNFVVPSGVSQWRTGPARPGLVAFRLAQVLTLAFALLVAVKRYAHPPALLGALLLASIATVSLALPMRMATFWRAFPPIVDVLLWIPFSTSAAVGAILFAFFAVFPHPFWSPRRLSVFLAPACLVIAWHTYAWHRIIQNLGPPTRVVDWSVGVFAINILYAGLAVWLLVAHRVRAETLTDRRRIRTLIVGVVAGVIAGGSVVFGHWRNPGADIFASRSLTLMSLVFLAVPASFAYAILRHRLFDIRVILRQGLRYALARRFVDALVPSLAAVFIVDVIVNRQDSLSTLLRTQWTWLIAVALALVVVRIRREHWLNSLDRRFFRERYDAQRLLRSVAVEITQGSSIETVAPAVAQRIDEALHPEFVSVLCLHRPESVFEAVHGGSAGSSIDDRSPAPLPTNLAVIGVLSALRKPLALSLGDTAWVRHQLPVAERSLLLNQGIELLVPISGQLPAELPLGLLALGPRRSEEPYNQEDLDLLSTIAHAVGVVLERSSAESHTFTECESCGRCFGAAKTVCPEDGRPLNIIHGSRLLNRRYRLKRRLGRGGMGSVYSAVDDVLERAVAVKLIRENVSGPLDLAGRFRREARAVARFNHPHVVRIHDFGIDRQERPFLVMELLEGETLRQRLSAHDPLTTSETLHILRGVCSALSAAHQQGLVHRDLKPENIFLQRHAEDVVPKVLDFGLAKTFTQSPLEHVTDSSSGLLVGTIDYMAPEQVAGDDVSPGWDLWAMGVIAYEMLTGSHPFRRRFPFPDDETIAESPVTDSRHTGPLNDTAAAFFRAALSTERSMRPSEAHEFLNACEKALL